MSKFLNEMREKVREIKEKRGMVYLSWKNLEDDVVAVVSLQEHEYRQEIATSREGRKYEYDNLYVRAVKLWDKDGKLIFNFNSWQDDSHGTHVKIPSNGHFKEAVEANAHHAVMTLYGYERVCKKGSDETWFHKVEQEFSGEDSDAAKSLFTEEEILLN